jgi:hypothetical protein
MRSHVKMSTVFAVTFALMAGSYSAYGQESARSIQLTAPKSGKQVGPEVVLEGTGTPPPGLYLWAIARESSFQPMWWPQREATIDYKAKQWSAKVVLGGDRDKGKTFDIGVVAVDSKGHSVLMDYWRNSMKSGDWRPIDLPAASIGPITVSVIRASN